MQPSTGWFHVVPYVNSVQLETPEPPPLLPNVRLAGSFDPMVPFLVHMFCNDEPFTKLSMEAPDCILAAACTKKALPNRLSPIASALMRRFTPVLSMPVAVMCHICADPSSDAVYS